MSNLAKDLEQRCDAVESCSAIKMLIQPRDRDLGGFLVRRVLPTHQQKMVGPWIFFDHMGPVDFPAGQGLNVAPHPHINLATVTYLFEGEILHRDSIGSLQSIRPGDINLMVAGRGIVHSERERPEVTAEPHRLHGLQLWLSLPEDDEEVDPVFYHYPATAIPEVTVAGVPLRVMMGSAYGVTSPVQVFAETLYVEARLQAGQTIALPNAVERAAYVASGSLRIQGIPIPEHSMAVFSSAEEIRLEALEDTQIAVIGGEKLGPRHIDWNFVSSCKSRIELAKEDWRAGRFPKVPGDELEFISLPD
ncbi:MAG: pirin family protein [Arenicellales bacterium]|nr:pirin family protein [Arenicellales bacterium]